MVTTPPDMPFGNLVANTIRTLSMDAVEKANSGHPGAPMGLADVATVLSTRFLKVCPSAPDWPDRDRLVLSAGHASMLLYSTLHLMGFDVSLGDIRDFRQWGSITPGHPENHVTPGVETTTGPLGQGLGNGVGMALAERMLADRFNTADRTLVDHFTYVITSDGDMMEGVQSEAASLAGHLGLAKLIVYFDSNEITIDGGTDVSFTEDVGKRYEAYGWHVLEVDGHNQEEMEHAFVVARETEDRPSLIIGHSHIGYGSPKKQDTSSSHGAPLGEDEVRATKKALGWPEDSEFFVPDEVYAFFSKRLKILEKEAEWWNGKLADLEKEDPALFAEWKRFQEGTLPETFPPVEFETGSMLATRKASYKCLTTFADAVPFLVGGSADLAGSNKTDFPDDRIVSREDFSGRTLRFGVREHGMGAILNGMALHKGFHPMGATFLIFSDYLRPSLRLAALMNLPVLYVFTHDSFYVGEDGPTHQPIEQLASLRAMPNVTVIRPGDAAETAVAWEAALRRKDGPTLLSLTRQGLPVLDRTDLAPAGDAARGGYVLWDSADDFDLILVATGSEVPLALEAGRVLAGEGTAVRVVSVPSFDIFLEQDEEWRESVLPATCTLRIGIEAGVRLGWDRWLGPRGRFIGMDRFGASAPGAENARRFGFTVENVVSVAREVLSTL